MSVAQKLQFLCIFAGYNVRGQGCRHMSNEKIYQNNKEYEQESTSDDPRRMGRGQT